MMRRVGIHGAGFVPISSMGTSVGAAAAPAVIWWNPDGATPAANVGGWRAKNAASLAASYLNVGLLGFPDIDPAVVGGVAPGWAAGTGWTFDGATQYLKTNIVPTDVHTMIISFANGAVLGDHCMCGTYNGTGVDDFSIWQITAGTPYYCNVALLATGAMVAGVLGMAAKNAYRNGVADGVIGGIPLATALDIWIGRPNGAAWWYVGDITGLFVSDLTLTAPQMLARATTMAAL